MNRTQFPNHVANKTTQCIVLLLLLIFLISCTKRERDNPFESGSNNTLLTLTLKPFEAQVELNWQFNRTLEDFTGFRVYRGIDSPDSLSFYAEVDASAREFTDTAVQQGRWYFYRVTVLGRSVESPPSETRRTLLGPGQYWVLSRGNFNVHRLSYDLRNTIQSYQTAYISDAWATPPNDSLFWIGTPTFASSVVSLNRRTGVEKFFFLDSLRFAKDLAYDQDRRRLYILDDASKKFFITRNENILLQISLDPNENYRELAFDPSNGQIWLLGENSVSMMQADSPGEFTSKLPFSSNFRGRDFDLFAGKVYLLISDETANTSQLLTLSSQLNVENTFDLTGIFYRIRFARQGGGFYLAKENNGANDALVKLNSAGGRLFELPEFEVITDIAVNPFDQTVVVADFFNNLVSAYDSDGNFISASQNDQGDKFIFEPVNLYIE